MLKRFTRILLSSLPATRGQVAGLHTHLNRIGETMAKELDTLTTEVSEATTVMSSAAALIGGLKVKLDEAITANSNGDPAKLAELSASLDTGANALAAAVAANTPAEDGDEPAEGQDPV